MNYEEAGSQDLTVQLGEHNATLTDISAADTTLVEGEDYTVDGRTVTIRKEYVAKIKEASHTTLTFTFRDGQQQTCEITIKKPEAKTDYTRDFSKTGLDGFTKVSGNGTLNLQDDAAAISGNGIYVDEKSADLADQEVSFTFDPQSNNCNYGVILRYSDANNYLYVGPAEQYGQHYTNWGIYGPNGQLAKLQDSGFVLSGRVVPYTATVRAIGEHITIFLDNEEIYDGVVPGVATAAGKIGFRSTASTSINVRSLTQTNAHEPNTATVNDTKTISSKAMTVTMDAEFPRVVKYELADGTTVQGQEKANHEVEINNSLYTPTVTSEANGDTITYHVTVDALKISFDTVFQVEDGVLTMTIRNVKDDQGTLLYTLNFPGHSLVSMSSTDPNAELRANNYQGQTETMLAEAVPSAARSETTLAVLSNANAAAAVSGLSYKNRHEVAYQTVQIGDHTSTGLWLNEYTYRGLDGEVMIDEPWAKVSVTQDRNADGVVDWQDGAIALRDDCKERKTGADVATSSWNMIAINVGSEAQYPFLRILDNAQKISLATDNFSQNIVIKGYQGEGHDASHPDYANYNEHAGGLTDFKTLLEQAEQINTKIGIHINQTDVYPESPQYDALKTSLGAWSWYDSASQIIRENDALGEFGTGEDGMDGRMAQLYDVDTEGKIDTTYVDVFFGTRWPLYNLVKNINGDSGSEDGPQRNMGLATEYVDEMVSFSTFSHHFNQAYSGFGGAGSLVRFVDNNQSDSFVNSSLFRGASGHDNEDIGIDGWQGAEDYNKAIQAFYERILPNKFLAQYPVMQYDSDTRAVLGEGNEVVTEMVNGVNVITLNGKKVAEGTSIFIPWDETDSTGETVKEQGKIYHWNTKGGTTTWQLPDSWSNVKTATLYKLSEKGKEKVDSFDVSGGSITINADAKQAYVLYQEELATDDIQTADTVDWSTGSPVKDMGFDSYNFDEWAPSSTTSENTDHIVIENNDLGNAHLFIKGTNDGQVEQKITGLTAGKTYSASVWAITDDGRDAAIEVVNGDETVSNYMNRSNVIYGVHHNDKYETNAQRMQVRFVAQSDTATLRLKAAAGDDAQSVVDFDDVRVMQVDASTNPDPDKYLYWEDFENTDQGWGVFVSTESDQSHLSQLNPVNSDNTTDVVDGNYSLKIRAGDYMRTIPATMRLEPNTEYTVSMRYKSPNANPFTFAVKSDKAQEAGDDANAVLDSVEATGTEGTVELKFTTGNYDDYYVDVTKLGSTEYYLDDFAVQEARPMNYETLQQLIAEAEALQENAYTPDSYAVLSDALAAAKKITDSDDKDAVVSAYTALEDAMNALVAYATAEDLQSLNDLIVQMKSLMSSDYKNDEQWMAFQTKIAEAEALHANDEATQQQVNQMMTELREAKDALNPIVDRTALHAIVAKANRVDRTAIVDGAEIQNFLSALEGAQQADIKPGVTEQEISEATSKLTDAYNAIVLKDDSKNTLVEQALDLADEDETYFLESDWAIITETAATFTAMQGQSGVKAADYYDNLIRLESALANKLSRPVIPSSVEIDPSGFTASANTAQTDTSGEGPIDYAFDQNPATLWHSAYSGFTVSASNPAEVTVDLGQTYTLNQFSYQQRASGDNGKIQKYNLYVKANESDQWQPVIEDGTFQNVAGVQKASFDSTQARYVLIQITQGIGNFASAAEFGFWQQASDFSALQEAMNRVDNLDESLYTAQSVEQVKAKYAQAEQLLDNLLTDQSTIDAMSADLNALVDGLVLVATSTDIKTLQDAVSDAENVSEDDYIITDDFRNALTAAQNLLRRHDDGEELTQTDVRNAAFTLRAAQDALEPQPDQPEPTEVDKSKLQDAVDKAIDDSQSSKYPTDAWDAYQAALAKAKSVLADENSTQEQVDDAVALLKQATDNLEQSLEPTDPDDPSAPDNPSDSDSSDDKKDQGSIADTGAQLPIIPGLVCLLVAGALFAFLVLKRRFEN